MPVGRLLVGDQVSQDVTPFTLLPAVVLVVLLIAIGRKMWLRRHRYRWVCPACELPIPPHSVRCPFCDASDPLGADR